MRKEWLDVETYEFQRGCLPLVVTTQLKFTSRDLSIARPRNPQLEMTDIGEDGNVLIGPAHCQY